MAAQRCGSPARAAGEASCDAGVGRQFAHSDKQIPVMNFGLTDSTVLIVA